MANYNYKAQSQKKTDLAWKDVYRKWKILPENLLMTDYFMRQEQTDRKQEIEMCCKDGIKNYIGMVVVDESIATCMHNKEDNNLSEDNK